MPGISVFLMAPLSLYEYGIIYAWVNMYLQGVANNDKISLYLVSAEQVGFAKRICIKEFDLFDG
jgi:hypothetical protein